MDKATTSKLAALTRERGPAWAQEQVAAQEAAYQAGAGPQDWSRGPERQR